jgi:hypothetical protein
MNGFTVCPSCLRTVRVSGGTICYHVHESWAHKACEGFKQDAQWVEKRSLIAMGRNSSGDCMACGQNVRHGHNVKCDQCGLPEDWIDDYA